MIKIFINARLKRLTNTYSRYKTFREYKDIRQIVLLFDVEDLTMVKKWVQALNADGKQVSAYSFEINKKEYPELPANFHIWNKEKLDLWGVPKNTEISTFKENKADTLIDLTKASSPVLRYLFLNSSAAFRVGFNQEYAQLYDLLIERSQEQDFSFFVNQMLFYMKSLRTK